MKKAFTLTELLVIVVIVGILAGIGIPTYQKTVAAQKSRVCQNHLKILNMSLKLYTLDNNALPASLSEIWPKYTGMALAQWEQEKRKSKLYCFVSWLRKLGLPIAHADILPPSYYNNDISFLACPADKTKPTATYDAQGRIISISGVSYGLNEDLVGLTSIQLALLPDVLSIVDSEKPEVDFVSPGEDDIVYRHQTGFWAKKNFANAITLGAMPVSTAKEEYESALGEVGALEISADMSDDALKVANSNWRDLNIDIKARFMGLTHPEHPEHSVYPEHPEHPVYPEHPEHSDSDDDDITTITSGTSLWDRILIYIRERMRRD